MAGKEPTVRQPYRAGDTSSTPWAEARERLADADTYWLVAAKQLPFAPVRSHPHIAADTKKAGEGRGHSPACSEADRYRGDYGTSTAGVRPRSPCSIAIMLVRCKQNPLRPGPSGAGCRTGGDRTGAMGKRQALRGSHPLGGPQYRDWSPPRKGPRPFLIHRIADKVASRKSGRIR